MMPVRWAILAFLLTAPGHGVRADPAPPSLHGIALGMTPDKVIAAADLPCSRPAYSDAVQCHDDRDGSDYQVTLSAGDPSIALSVQRSFCSHETAQTVLKQILADLRVPGDRAHQDPNGFHIDLDGNSEAILDADDGTCQGHDGKHYLYLIRSNALINMSSQKAVERAKKALH